MLVSIITLNFQKPQLTISCIKSLKINFGKELADGKMEIIVVDNASGDSSVDLIEKEIKNGQYKNTRLIKNTTNDGFGKGNNVGARSAKGDNLLFLNNDTIVNDRKILEMSKYLKDHDSISILGGQFRNLDGSLQVSSGSFYTLGRAVLLLLGLQKFGLVDKSPEKITAVDWIKGGLFMIKKEAFWNLNGFDEKIFMYMEDMELCYRASLRGYGIFFYPDINVLHIEHGSANRSFAVVNIYKSILYFYKKHKTYAEYVLLKILLLMKAALLIFAGTIIKNDYLKKTYSQALKSIK